MGTGRNHRISRRAVFVLLLIFIGQAIGAEKAGSNKSPTSKTSPAALDYAKLMENQEATADRPIFDSDKFPGISLRNSDLIIGALGTYKMTVRFFDAAYNEVTKAGDPGRYGALVEIRFSNGYSDVQHITLYKTPKPYRTYLNLYSINAQLPDAFGISNELQQREKWNMDDFFYDTMRNESRRGDSSAVLANSLLDKEADPERWQGFNYWASDGAWWNGLEKKLGTARDYKRLVELPPGYAREPDKHWPLILFLHGSGERGDDLGKLQKIGPQRYINSGHALPFIVVSPQCPKHSWWSPEKLNQLLNQLETQFRVDPKRIYVTGLSMGGYGTFDLAATSPQRFAAIAPLAGGENPDIAARLKTIPAWLFHGGDDSVVRTQFSTDIADKMKALGATEVKLTVYPKVGHDKWELTYEDPDLYSWFLKHSLP